MKVRLISSSCNNAMELVNFRAIDAECSRALLLTPGFSRVQKAERSTSRSTAFLARQKLLKQFRCMWLQALGLKPGVNKSSRLKSRPIARDHCCSHRFAASKICPEYGPAVFEAW